jgi:hypothetical protein
MNQANYVSETHLTKAGLRKKNHPLRPPFRIILGVTHLLLGIYQLTKYLCYGFDGNSSITRLHQLADQFMYQNMQAHVTRLFGLNY